MEEKLRRIWQRERTFKFLHDLIDKLMHNYNLTNTIKLRKILETLVEEEEELYGVGKGLNFSAVCKMAELYFVILGVRPITYDGLV